jgi:hypothetical protein
MVPIYVIPRILLWSKSPFAQHRPGKLLIYGARHIARIDRQRLGFLATVIFSVTFCLKFFA